MKKANNKTVRDILYIKQDGLCYYCGCDMTPWLKGVKGVPTDNRCCTIDHVIAKSTGGAKRKLSNMVAACYQCNTVKGKTEVAHFIERLSKMWDKYGNPHPTKEEKDVWHKKNRAETKAIWADYEHRRDNPEVS